MNYFDNKVNNRVDIENSVLTYLDNCGVSADDYDMDKVVDYQRLSEALQANEVMK